MANFGTIFNQLPRLERIVAGVENGKPGIPPCRCCGGKLGLMDGITEAVREGVDIHTRCILKHWTKHDKNINATRCKDSKTQIN